MKIAIALLALLFTPCLSLSAAAADVEAIPPTSVATLETGSVGAEPKPTGTPKQETSESTPKKPCWWEEAFPDAKKLTPAERIASVIAIGVLFPGAVILLLAGAIGGLLARLRKAIKQKSVAFDFGVSWGVMFLTPLVGAITGWLGVAMVQVLLAWEFLGEQLLPLQLYEPNLYTAVLAFLFGLSATLFDKFVERFESSLAPDERNRRTSGELEALAAQEESGEWRNRQERDAAKHVDDEREAQPTARARSGEEAGESPGSPERGVNGPKKTD